VAAVRLPLLEELELEALEDELDELELDEPDELEAPPPLLPALLLPPPPHPAIKTSVKRPAAHEILALPATSLPNEFNDISHSRFMSLAHYYMLALPDQKTLWRVNDLGQAHLSYNRTGAATTRLFYICGDFYMCGAFITDRTARNPEDSGR
jgi:hypothetical protein